MADYLSVDTRAIQRHSIAIILCIFVFPLPSRLAIPFG